MKFGLIISFMFFATLLVGCLDDSGSASLSVSNTTFTVPASGGNIEFEVLCDEPWSLNYQEDWVSMTRTLVEWVTIVNVTVEENATGADRQSVIRVQSGKVHVDVTVKQNGFDVSN